jgi:hypothetical protein
MAQMLPRIANIFTMPLRVFSKEDLSEESETRFRCENCMCKIEPWKPVHFMLDKAYCSNTCRMSTFVPKFRSCETSTERKGTPTEARKRGGTAFSSLVHAIDGDGTPLAHRMGNHPQ